jgi:hypothetical protein
MLPLFMTGVEPKEGFEPLLEARWAGSRSHDHNIVPSGR